MKNRLNNIIRMGRGKVGTDMKETEERCRNGLLDLFFQPWR